MCQGREIDSSDILARGSILFGPGTSTPIAHSGVGKCLTESETSSMSPEDLECSFPEDAAVFLEGAEPPQSTIDLPSSSASSSEMSSSSSWGTGTSSPR